MGKVYSILDFIPTGKENAITRQQLCEKLYLDDRTVIQMIEHARDSGHVILSSSQVSGYWFSNDIEEVNQFVLETKSRIKKLQKAIAPAEKAVNLYYANKGE